MVYTPVAVFFTAQKQVSWGFKTWLWTKGRRLFFSFHLVGFLTLIYGDSASALMLFMVWVVKSVYSELRVQISFYYLDISYLSMSCCTPLGFLRSLFLILDCSLIGMFLQGHQFTLLPYQRSETSWRLFPLRLKHVSVSAGHVPSGCASVSTRTVRLYSRKWVCQRLIAGTFKECLL